MKPVVAIIGRPNVGKSTLFNRLVGGRKAITLDTPGVTRDRHYGTCEWDGRSFLIIDTGGIEFADEGTIERKIHDQVDIALQEANAILFLLDGRTGLVPEEREIARTIRRFGKPVFFVINKIDTEKQNDCLADFYELGEDIYPVSAEHGYLVNDLLDKVIEKLPEGETEEKTGRPISVAIIGRPNVGKSSLLNHFLGTERVLVHNQPGTTRDPIDTLLRVEDQEYRLIDTAGIRRGAKSATRVERYSVISSLKTIERADVCLLVLDAVEGIHRQDAHVAGYITEARKALVILWNKWDLVTNKKGISAKEARKSFERQAYDQLKFIPYSPLLFVSARTGEGCSKIWTLVKDLHAACGRRVSTSDVNRVFEGLVDGHSPPVYKGKPVKFFYATQTNIRPPTFVAFVNEPKGVHFSYKRYLLNGFREAFKFGGAPIEILFRRKR